MSREKVEALLADVVPRIEEIRDEALARIAEVRADADEKIRRHGEARGELEGVEGEIESLRSENAELPVLHSRAVLDDDVEEELRLKDRAQEIRERIARLEERRDELWQEIGSLLTRNQGHRLDADIEHTARVARAAASEKEATERLRKRLVEAVGGAADAVFKEWEEARAEVQNMGNKREWEQSPVGQGAIRS